MRKQPQVQFQYEQVMEYSFFEETVIKRILRMIAEAYLQNCSWSHFTCANESGAFVVRNSRSDIIGHLDIQYEDFFVHVSEQEGLIMLTASPESFA